MAGTREAKRNGGNAARGVWKTPRLSEMGDLRQRWEPMRVVHIGDIPSVVMKGKGKTVITTGDPGEPKKVPSLDP